MKFWKYFALLIVMFCGTISPLTAQAYRFNSYDQESGLVDGYVYGIVQDELGFLYLSTGTGLFRFDGQKFKWLKESDGLAEDFVSASHRDAKGNIWLGHKQGGLTLLRDMKLKALKKSPEISTMIVGFAEDAKGTVWCASQSGVFRLDTTGVVEFFKDGIETQNVLSIAIGKAGSQEYCLVGTDEGLIVYQIKNNDLIFRFIPKEVPNDKVICVYNIPSRATFLLGTKENGLFEFHPALEDTSTYIIRHDAKSGFPMLESVQTILVDNARDVWVGTRKGTFKFRDVGDGQITLIKPFIPNDTLKEQDIRSLYQDKFGQIWIGSYGKGLTCLSEQDFSTFRLQKDSLGKIQILCSMEDRIGDFWLGTNKGLYQIDRSTVASAGGRFTLEGLLTLGPKRKFGLADGLPSEIITSILEDGNQNIWIGTKANGVALLEKGNSKFVAKSFSDLDITQNINDLAIDQSGTIWIASTDGAFSYQPSTGKANYFGTQNKLPHNYIFDIFCDQKGNLWFATHTNRVAVYDGHSFTNIEVSDATGEVPNINCINQSKDGSIWLGTDGNGVYRYQNEKFQRFTTNEGLQSNFVYQVIVDHYDNIWMTHREGISRLIQDTQHIITYPTKSILPVDENPISHAMQDVFGNIWFSSEFGLVKYSWNPTRNKTTPPTIMINSVQINDSLHDIKLELSLPFAEQAIRFNFLGLTFLNQAEVLYQYRLVGRDQEWSAPSKQDYVTFQNLIDGEYTFEVRACNLYGNCNSAAAKFSFSIAPPFWKAWWFRLIVALVLIGLIFAYFRYRLYRLKKEKAILEDRVRERTVELEAEKTKVEAANIELEKLSLVASETDNAVFILNAQGSLTWVNAGFTRLTGYLMEELLEIRQTKQEFLSSSSDPLIKDRLETAIRENRSVQYESTLPSRKGKDIWVLSTMTPIFDQQGKLRNIVIIDSNITERKEAEEKIQTLNAELESQVVARTRELAEANESLQQENIEHIKTAEQLKVINSELDTFVYRASHDLKGPLASLMGLINIAGMELGDNAIATRYLGLMDKASKRLDGILVDLIEATQVKQRSIELVPINTLSLAESVAEIVKQGTDMNKAAINLTIDPQLEIVSDEQLLTAILQNFLANALKYRDPSKELATATLKISKENGWCNIAVTDNGIGILPEIQGRVFDMFYRGNHATGGSGLGLYIVKQAAEKLGGEVSLESILGVGTTMKARIPA